MIGQRIMPNADGWLTEPIPPGGYGKPTHPSVIGKRTGWWVVCAPDGHSGCLNPELHTVIEHEDGTITVSPSIDFSKRITGGFHGYLKNGIWTSC